jgi:uncharacterized protein YcfJ
MIPWLTLKAGPCNRFAGCGPLSEGILIMKNLRVSIAALSAASLLAACAQQPIAPTVQVMPAPNKPFAAFQEDDVICRNYAAQSSVGVAESGNNQQVGSAVVGTLLGAGLGAAIGGGQGAAIGAGAGALGGTAYGTGAAAGGQYTAQQIYNNAYTQCMYSRGNQVPGYYAPSAAAPPPGAYPPPPPPGPPPPPPPPRT